MSLPQRRVVQAVWCRYLDNIWTVEIFVGSLKLQSGVHSFIIHRSRHSLVGVVNDQLAESMGCHAA